LKHMSQGPHLVSGESGSGACNLLNEAVGSARYLSRCLTFLHSFLSLSGFGIFFRFQYFSHTWTCCACDLSHSSLDLCCSALQSNMKPYTSSDVGPTPFDISELRIVYADSILQKSSPCFPKYVQPSILIMGNMLVAWRHCIPYEASLLVN